MGAMQCLLLARQRDLSTIMEDAEEFIRMLSLVSLAQFAQKDEIEFLRERLQNAAI